MPKIYTCDNALFTPFNKKFLKEDYEYLVSKGFEFISDVDKADVIVAYSEKNLKRFFRRNPWKKNLVIWTNEPRFSQVVSAYYKPYLLLPKVAVMNVYTGDVFVNNVTYQMGRFYGGVKLCNIDHPLKINRKLVALMSYYNGGKNMSLIVDCGNIDLVKLRSDIALFGHRHNLIDIYGNGWPEGIAKENSRMGNWVDRKSFLLKNYNFNLCFENTVYPNYITEKIWDSIENYCLPVYFGGNGSSIYEIFPRGSFLDYAEFGSPENLYNYVREITAIEYISRMNLCIEVYNSYIEKPFSFWQKTKKLMLNNIVERFAKIAERK